MQNGSGAAPLLAGHAHHLGHGRRAAEDLLDGRLAQRAHALFARRFEDLGRAGFSGHETAQAVGALMKALGQRYVQYVNRTYRRSGTLWEGRFRSCLTQDDTYLLACQRYIELNPVRAGMVAHPQPLSM